MALSVPAGADSAVEPNYQARARAVGLDATLTNSSLPLNLVVRGVGPESQVFQSSLGQGDAFASFPYTGDVIPTLPGLLGGALGLPTPPYPFLAASNAGQKPVDVEFPSIHLHAESNNASTVATGAVGNDATGIATLARVDQAADGSVTSTADVQFEGIKLGNLLTVNGVHSRAEVTGRAGSRALARKATLTVGEIVVPGLAISLPGSTPSKIPLPIPIPGLPNIPPIDVPPLPVPFGGQILESPRLGLENGTFTVSLPLLGDTQRFTVPSKPVLDALRALGIRVAFEEAQDIGKGIIAPTLSFTFDVPALPENQFVSGPVPVTFTLGGTQALVDIQPTASGPGASGNPAGARPPAVGPGSSPVLPGSGSGAMPGAAGAEPEAVTGVVGSEPGGTGVGPAPEVAGDDWLPPSTVTQASELLASADGFAGAGDLSEIYLVIVGAAGLAFAAANALRLMGVRFLWSS